MIKRKSTNHVHFLFDWVRTMLLAQWGGIISFIAVAFITELFIGPSAVLFALLGGIVFAATVGQAQQNLLQDYTDADFEGWTLFSAMGGGLSALPVAISFGSFSFIFYLAGLEGIASIFPSILPQVALSIFTLMSLLHWFKLREHVDHAWLWVLANVVGALMFIPFVQGSGIVSMLVMLTLAMLAQNIVTGVTMLFLFLEDSHPDDGLPDEDRYARAYVELYTRDERPYE